MSSILANYVVPEVWQENLGITVPEKAVILSTPAVKTDNSSLL